MFNSFVSNVHQHIEGEIMSVFTMSDKTIKELIFATHVHSDQKSFDEDSLFLIVENVVMRSSQIIDEIIQGVAFHVDNIEEFTEAKLSVPLCTLKAINSELSFKAPNEETAHKTTMAILNKLTNYSWEAKAVLALAAFAFEFGDFWLMAQLYHSDPLAKDLAVLNRVPALMKTISELQKRRQAVFELSSLIMVTMRVIAIFDEFERLSACYDFKSNPGLSTALDHMPVDVYWAILTIAACATKLSILISDEPDRDHDLSPYAQKISYILNRLTMQLNVIRRQLGKRVLL
ncbi:protein SIEVE ELEMENT OCCLUSION B-like [Humulus lupulus]|uniref:protein SIEVE ELEMENT OCCLUSION B-like n=1 Tax=Humulus lupulus TaxID=3486 RepID=UPI002B402ACD|nr:protein SIEVE ELEMENT OCCLUSION B-like [Humulus lupulus]